MNTKSMRPGQIRPATLALLVLVVLLVAACGATPTPAGTDAVTATPTATATPSPTPTATALPTPTATDTPSPAPSPTVTATSNPSDVNSLADRAMVHLRWLSQTLGIRASTSPEEREAAEYISNQLRSFGYQVEVQEFPVRAVEEVGRHLQVEAAEPHAFLVTVLAGSGRGEVTAPLTFVGLGKEDDFSVEGLDGRVALIERGEIAFGEKVENARRAGAVGVVIFNNVPGLFLGTLGGAFDIPAAGISRADGEELLRLLEEGEVTVTFSVLEEERSSQNVVATGNEGEGPIVVLGAHYDSVPESPGANDNGSGTAVLLALAQELAGRDLPVELRFIAFGSEELGLLGSFHYVGALPQEEQERIVAMLNFDALGTGGLAIGGDNLLVSGALARAVDLGIDAFRTQEPAGASSDHAPFRGAGVPVIFFFGSDFSRIHTPDDRIEFVDPQLLGEAAVLGLGIVASLAG